MRALASYASRLADDPLRAFLCVLLEELGGAPQDGRPFEGTARGPLTLGGDRPHGRVGDVLGVRQADRGKDLPGGRLGRACGAAAAGLPRADEDAPLPVRGVEQPYGPQSSSRW